MEPDPLEKRRAELDAQIAAKELEIADIKSRLPSAFDVYKIFRMNGKNELADKMDAFYGFEAAALRLEQARKTSKLTYTLEEILAELEQ